MRREAMKLALEALEEINKLSIGENAICLPAEIDGAMDALRERLAQPEQELVMKRIKTWSERCEEHPDHQQGMISEGMIRARMQEEIDELRQALETEQEPVAWLSEGGDVSRSKRYMDEMGFKCNPLYTAPPKREWVGLTEKEVKAIANKRNDYGLPMTGRMWVFVADLTDKLKEKNA
jgi:hypothetical protein